MKREGRRTTVRCAHWDDRRDFTTDDGRPFATLTGTMGDFVLHPSSFRLRPLSLICVVTIVFVALAGCATLTGAGRDVETANCLFEKKQYHEAITAYRKVLSEHPDSGAAANARFNLAYTLAFYDNPQKDYAQALQEFEEFLRLYPHDHRAQTALNWRQVLKTLQDVRQSIEQLKKLDIKHEEKRKRM